MPQHVSRVKLIATNVTVNNTGHGIHCSVDMRSSLSNAYFLSKNLSQGVHAVQHLLLPHALWSYNNWINCKNFPLGIIQNHCYCYCQADTNIVLLTNCQYCSLQVEQFILHLQVNGQSMWTRLGWQESSIITSQSHLLAFNPSNGRSTSSVACHSLLRHHCSLVWWAAIRHTRDPPKTNYCMWWIGKQCS